MNAACVAARGRSLGTGNGTGTSGAKSDKADARTLADMVRTDSHQLRPVAGGR